MPREQIVSPLALIQNAFSLVKHKLIGYTGISIIALGFDLVIFSANVANGLNHTFAAALGYVCGLVVHFLLSRHLVFGSKARGKRIFVEALGYLLSGLAGLIITVGVVFLASDIIGLGSAISKAAAVLFSFVCVYLMRSRIVFGWKGGDV
jgi:putative flippase GtrA